MVNAVKAVLERGKQPSPLVLGIADGEGGGYGEAADPPGHFADGPLEAGDGEITMHQRVPGSGPRSKVVGTVYSDSDE